MMRRGYNQSIKLNIMEKLKIKMNTSKITGYKMEAEILEVFRWRELNFCFVQIESVGKSYRAILNYESGYPITPTGIGLSYMSTRTKAQTAITKAISFLDEKYSEDLSMLNAKENITKNKENTELDDNYFIENNFINKKKNKKTKKIKQKLMFLCSGKETKTLAVIKKIVPYKIKDYEFNLALVQNVFGHTYFVEYSSSIPMPIDVKRKNESLSKYENRFFREFEELIKQKGRDYTIERINQLDKINFGAEPSKDDVRIFLKEIISNNFGIGLTYFKNVFYKGTGRNKKIDYELLQECINMDENCFFCLPKQIKSDKEAVKMCLRKNLLMITKFPKIKEMSEVKLHAIKHMDEKDRERLVTHFFAEVAQITEQEAKEIINGDFYDLSMFLMNFKAKPKKINKVKKTHQVNCACCCEKIEEQKDNHCKSCFDNLDEKALNLEVKIEELEEQVEENQVKIEKLEERIAELEIECQKNDIVLKIEEKLEKNLFILNAVQEYCVGVLTGEIDEDDLRAFLNNSQK